jgi:hypothetical protein
LLYRSGPHDTKTQKHAGLLTIDEIIEKAVLIILFFGVVGHLALVDELIERIENNEDEFCGGRRPCWKWWWK